MNLIDLQKSLRAVEPAAVLVPPRVLENIVKQSWSLSGFYWTVPHKSNFVIDRQTLFRHVDQEDLVLEPNELLPATVMLLAWPTEEISARETPAQLLKYWQQVFHASVHLLLENQWNEGKLTQTALRSRITDIGPAQFEEIKNVLVQDQCLPGEASERLIYIEFAAHFLEEYYFTSGLLDGTFPSLRNKEEVRKLLEHDVDGAALFKRTRLVGAADPVVQTVSTSREAHEFYDKLIESSERATEAGNVVLAAIQRRRAARVAPPDQAILTMERARADMHNLACRLKDALDLDDGRALEWEKDLVTLLDKADQGARPAEAAMLYDLERVCLDNEHDIYALDLIEWLMSMGRRPIKRPLPSQRLVRLTRHLRSATQRLTMARLSDRDRRHLEELLQSAAKSCETRLRDRFRRVFVDAFEDVGLKPRNPPEKVAFDKVIEELLDRILEFGFLTFSDMRDILSRNQLKLPDLTDPGDFILGDPLIRLDRRLATLLDGVYRRSEFYLRWLERCTALTFGTAAGRLLTRFVMLPFGTAFLLIETGNLISNMVARCVRFFRQPATFDQTEAEMVASTIGHLSAPLGQGPMLAAPPVVSTVTPSMLHKLGTLEFGSPVYIALFALLGIFMLALLHSARVRHKVGEMLGSTLGWVQLYLVKGPMSLLRSGALKNASKSWLIQLFYWYVFKPLILFVLIWLLMLVLLALTRRGVNPELPWWGWAIVFLAGNFLVNSRPGQTLTNAMSYSTVQFLEQVRAGLLPRLFNLIIGSFKYSVHFVQSMLVQVDEWLRFRAGDTPASLAVRTVLTVFWFPIRYLTQFNLVVFIEPLFNPLKLPVCSIAFKFWLPFYIMIQGAMADYPWPLWAVLSWINFWCADAFGFIFWEVKENWNLYRSNRSKQIRPVAIGPHGETLAGLLQPGFHSGTVPKLYIRLREAERTAHATGNWKGVRTCQAELDKVKESVRLFLVREFVALLDQDPHWRKQGSLDHLVQIGFSSYSQGQGMNVGKVHLATNMIRVELAHPRFEEEAVQLEFVDRSGWLVAGFGNVGWLKNLSDKQLRPLHNALVTLYKLAGVDLVREQLHAVLPPEAAAADLSPQGIFVRQEGRPVPAVIYDLVTPADAIAPRLLDGQPIEGWPTLTHRQVLFQEVPVTWDECIRCWQAEVKGDSSARKQVQYLAPDIEFMPRGLGIVPVIRNGANGNAGHDKEIEAQGQTNGDGKLEPGIESA